MCVGMDLSTATNAAQYSMVRLSVIRNNTFRQFSIILKIFCAQDFTQTTQTGHGTLEPVDFCGGQVRIVT